MRDEMGEDRRDSDCLRRRQWLRRASTTSDMEPPPIPENAVQRRRRPSLYERLIQERVKRGIQVSSADRRTSTSSADSRSSSLSYGDSPCSSLQEYRNSAHLLDESHLDGVDGDRRTSGSRVSTSRCHPPSRTSLPLLDSLAQLAVSGDPEGDVRRCGLAEQSKCVRFREGWKSARGTGSMASSFDDHLDEPAAAPLVGILKKQRCVNGSDVMTAVPNAREIVDSAVRAVFVNCNGRGTMITDGPVEDLHERSESSPEEEVASFVNTPRTVVDEAAHADVEKKEGKECQLDDKDEAGKTEGRSVDDDSGIQSHEETDSSHVDEDSESRDQKLHGSKQLNHTDDQNHSNNTSNDSTDSIAEGPAVVMAFPRVWNPNNPDEVPSPHSQMLMPPRDRLLLRRWTLDDGLGVTRSDHATIRRRLFYVPMEDDPKRENPTRPVFEEDGSALEYDQQDQRWITLESPRVAQLVKRRKSMFAGQEGASTE